MASDDTLTCCTPPYKVHTAASVEKRRDSLFFKGLRLALTRSAKGVASLLIRRNTAAEHSVFQGLMVVTRAKLTGTAMGGYPEPEP